MVLGDVGFTPPTFRAIYPKGPISTCVRAKPCEADVVSEPVCNGSEKLGLPHSARRCSRL